MAIASLINNLQGSVGGVVNTLLGNTNRSPGYIDFPEVGVDFQEVLDHREKWFSAPTPAYAFEVVNLSKEETGGSDDGSSGDFSWKDALSAAKDFFGIGQDVSGNFTEFPLPISPQEIQQSENFATVFRPTQGGTAVHHSGNKYKDLIISGTTGIAPFKSITGASRLTGKAIAQPDELKYRSGYEVFRHFRNFIKSYVEHKSKPEGKTVQLLWKNYKDWEFLYVEPIKFTMRRDVSSPLTYKYNIVFKVLGHKQVPKPELGALESIDRAFEIGREVLEQGRGILKKAEEVIRSTAGLADQLIDDLRRFNLGLKAAAGIGVTLTDVSAKINQNFLTERDRGKVFKAFTSALESAKNDPVTLDKLEPPLKEVPNVEFPTAEQLTEIIESYREIAKDISLDAYSEAALEAIQLEQIEAATTSREKIEQTKKALIELKDKFMAANGLDDSDYNRIFDRTSEGKPAPAEIDDTTFEILYGFKLAQDGLDYILQNDEFFDTNAELFANNNAKSGVNTIGAGIFSFPNANTEVKDAIFPANTTLEEIALIELGDSSRWTEIAELNNLKAPYFDTTSTDAKKTNYIVRSSGFKNPLDIRSLSIKDQFLILNADTGSAWENKQNFVAEYTGGDKTLASSWVFKQVLEGTIIKVIDIDKLYEYDGINYNEISEDAVIADGILRPGDIFKLPTGNAVSFNPALRGPRDNKVTNNLSSLEKSFLVDLKLDENWDLDLNGSGDINVAFSYENIAQAIVLKLFYSPGELKKFPALGASLGVGQKIPQNLNVLKQAVFSALVADPRIETVKNIQVIKDQPGTVKITMDVFFNKLSDPVPVTIPV